ncbi:MAG: hypothetical protein ACQETQ_03060 [Spirochaetota bacterium]
MDFHSAKPYLVLTSSTSFVLPESLSPSPFSIASRTYISCIKSSQVAKYRGDLSIYYRLLRRYDGDLSAVIDVLRVAATAKDDPRSYIASLVNAVPE